MKYILITLTCVLLSVNIVFAQSYASSSASASAGPANSSASSSSTSYSSQGSLSTSTSSTNSSFQSHAVAQVQNGQLITVQNSFSNPSRTVTKTYHYTNKVNNITKVQAPIELNTDPSKNVKYIELVPKENEPVSPTETGSKDYQKRGTQIAQLIPLNNHSTETIKGQNKRIDKMNRTNQFLTIGFFALALMLLILIVSLIILSTKNKSKRYF